MELITAGNVLIESRRSQPVDVAESRKIYNQHRWQKHENLVIYYPILRAAQNELFFTSFKDIVSPMTTPNMALRILITCMAVINTHIITSQHTCILSFSINMPTSFLQQH